MKQITLAHDYFLQLGGAERVAGAWLEHFEKSNMYTMLHDPESTFTSLDAARIRARFHGSHYSHLVPALLPVLPYFARQVVVNEGDIALVSTSGWAHQFQYDVPTVAYVHSPARWLYAREDYKLGLTAFRRMGMRISYSHLRRADHPAMRRMTRIVSNSKTTQSRVWRAYGVDSPVIPPPVARLDVMPLEPQTPLPDRFLLIVARNRGYKGLGAAAEIARRVGRSLVVIGSGTEILHNPTSSIFGVGKVTDNELKWLYRHADLLLATGREDFGLTVLEANAEGTPVVAVPAGGYLETVQSDVNGVFTEGSDPTDFGPALHRAFELSPEDCRKWAEQFSLPRHMARLQEVMDDVEA